MITLKTKLATASDDTNYGGVYYNIFPVRAKDVTELLAREKNATRVIVEINGKGRIFRALMADGKGDYLILVNKEICRKYDLEEQGEVVLTLLPDDSEYGMPLPEELAELWAMDEEAYRVFHTLTPGKQRGLMYVIAKPKGADTRIKKAVQISEYLKSVNGKLDYKELNIYMKEDNANW